MQYVNLKSEPFLPSHFNQLFNLKKINNISRNYNKRKSIFNLTK